MKFAHVESLFFIWIVPLLALVFYFGLRRRRTLLARWADRSSLSGLVPPGIAVRRRTRALLILVSVAMLAVALAGPQYGFEWRRIQTEGVDLIIALDCSRSMLAQDIQPTRMDRSKREIIDLLAMLEGDRAGLVAFSGTAFLQCPLTIDYAAFDLFLGALTPDYLPVGGTDLGAAVNTAISAFDPNSAADKAIILISDGENTGAGDPMQAAAAAKKAGIKLFCIGVGSAEGVPVPAGQGGFQKDGSDRIVMSRLDEATLSAMALATGGIYARSVAGDMDLEAIYRDHIRKEMQAATAQSDRKQVWADRFQWPLSLAVILLAAALLRPLTPKSGLMVCGLWLILATTGTAQAGPLQEGARAYHEGDYPQALQHMIAGQLEDPDDPRVLYNLGNAFYKNGDFEAAYQHYDQALTHARSASGLRDQDEGKEFTARLFYNLGNTAYRRGSLAQAVENYKNALALTPDDSQAEENLAFVQKQIENRPPQPEGQDESDPSRDQKNQNQAMEQQPRDDSATGERNPQARSDANNTPQNGGEPGTPPPQSGDQAGSQEPQGEQDSDPQALPAGQAEAQPSERGENTEDKKSAIGEQLLNRLKDEPGRAMMPNYQKRRVEKDW